MYDNYGMNDGFYSMENSSNFTLPIVVVIVVAVIIIIYYFTRCGNKGDDCEEDEDCCEELTCVSKKCKEKTNVSTLTPQPSLTYCSQQNDDGSLSQWECPNGKTLIDNPSEKVYQNGNNDCCRDLTCGDWLTKEGNLCQENNLIFNNNKIMLPGYDIQTCCNDITCQDWFNENNTCNSLTHNPLDPEHEGYDEETCCVPKTCQEWFDGNNNTCDIDSHRPLDPEHEGYDEETCCSPKLCEGWFNGNNTCRGSHNSKLPSVIGYGHDTCCFAKKCREWFNEYNCNPLTHHSFTGNHDGYDEDTCCTPKLCQEWFDGNNNTCNIDSHRPLDPEHEGYDEETCCTPKLCQEWFGVSGGCGGSHNPKPSYHEGYDKATCCVAKTCQEWFDENDNGNICGDDKKYNSSKSGDPGYDEATCCVAKTCEEWFDENDNGNICGDDRKYDNSKSDDQGYDDATCCIPKTCQEWFDENDNENICGLHYKLLPDNLGYDKDTCCESKTCREWYMDTLDNTDGYLQCGDRVTEEDYDQFPDNHHCTMDPKNAINHPTDEELCGDYSLRYLHRAGDRGMNPNILENTEGYDGDTCCIPKTCQEWFDENDNENICGDDKKYNSSKSGDPGYDDATCCVAKTCEEWNIDGKTCDNNDRKYDSSKSGDPGYDDATCCVAKTCEEWNETPGNVCPNGQILIDNPSEHVYGIDNDCCRDATCKEANVDCEGRGFIRIDDNFGWDGRSVQPVFYLTPNRGYKLDSPEWGSCCRRKYCDDWLNKGNQCEIVGKTAVSSPETVEGDSYWNCCECTGGFGACPPPKTCDDWFYKKACEEADCENQKILPPRISIDDNGNWQYNYHGLCPNAILYDPNDPSTNKICGSGSANDSWDEEDHRDCEEKCCGTWIVGDSGETCDETCSKAGKTCSPYKGNKNDYNVWVDIMRDAIIKKHYENTDNSYIASEESNGRNGRAPPAAMQWRNGAPYIKDSKGEILIQPAFPNTNPLSDRDLSIGDPEQICTTAEEEQLREYKWRLNLHPSDRTNYELLSYDDGRLQEIEIPLWKKPFKTMIGRDTLAPETEDIQKSGTITNLESVKPSGNLSNPISSNDVQWTRDGLNWNYLSKLDATICNVPSNDSEKSCNISSDQDYIENVKEGEISEDVINEHLSVYGENKFTGWNRKVTNQNLCMCENT